MKSVKPFLRGWLAISFIQQFALAFQHLFNPKILYRNFLGKETNDVLGGQIFALICFQQSILKCAILIKEENDRFLHIYHAINDTVYLLFFIFKVIYGDFVLSNGVLILIVFAGISLILTVTFIIQSNYSSHQNEIPENRKLRARKLISSHYLESDISDYNNPISRKNK